MQIQNPSFGGDPEIFTVDAHGTFVCPYSVMPTNKKVLPLSAEGGFNRDGMALELNPKPSAVPEIVWARFQHLMKRVSRLAKEHNLTLSTGARLNLDKSKVPDNVPGVRDIGCHPDMNAYTGNWNQITEQQLKTKLRFAGGHISVGIATLLDLEESCQIVREFFDPILGLGTMTLEDPKVSMERRKFYGSAGSFRYTPMEGFTILEYRTPTNAWLWTDGAYVRLTTVLKKALDRGVLPLPVSHSEVRKIINTGEFDMANAIWKEISQ